MRTRAQVGRRLEERTRQLEAAREDVALSAVANERLRIARELHDVVAHSISVMTIQAGAARMLLDEGPDRAEEPLLRVEETGRETLCEMRRLLGVLRKDMTPQARLEARPSLEHIGALLEQYRAIGLPVELVVEGDERTLPAGPRPRCLPRRPRSAHEHAQAVPEAPVPRYRRLRRESLELTVSDTARPKPQDDRDRSGGGHGLVGMRERAEIYGGRLEAGPRGRAASASRIRFPLERAAA